MTFDWRGLADELERGLSHLTALHTGAASKGDEAEHASVISRVMKGVAAMNDIGPDDRDAQAATLATVREDLGLSGTQVCLELGMLTLGAIIARKMAEIQTRQTN